MKENKEEKIASAAIKWRLKKGVEEHIFTGKSHAACVAKFAVEGITMALRDMDFEQQGFVTTDGRFVDREEALVIAKEAGQVDEGYKHEALYSEYCNFAKEEKERALYSEGLC